MRHRQTKGPDTDRPDLNNRVTSRLYTFGVVPPICPLAINSGFRPAWEMIRELRQFGTSELLSREVFWPGAYPIHSAAIDLQ